MVYEYVCKTIDCDRSGQTVEISVSLNKADLPAYCPGCLEKMEKLISKTSFSLKGTGWARDGYGNKR